jgi:uncharacterized protein YodC (DUF2158 family)
MADTFKPGDTVRLKSGGPVMTVTNIDNQFGVACEWFSGNKPERKLFRPEALVKAEPESEKKPRS